MILRDPPRILGRYLMCAPIASGGMATVHLGRMLGPQGFSRTVAIKQLHAQFARDSDFVSMFLDEACITSRIRHPNVVAPLDIVETEGELYLVMEYVHGESLARLMQATQPHRVPPRVASAIVVQSLLGLHAAHEATDDDGQALCIVHRDVSPQNILVGEDGITRVVDFGIAKAARRLRNTEGGTLKGKLGYMSPEQLQLADVDRRSDVFLAGIILWELLAGCELFTANEPAAAILQMLRFEPSAPSSVNPEIPSDLDAIALKALSVNREDRFATAKEMAQALELACPPAGAIEISEWVTRLVGRQLGRRAEWMSDIERMSQSFLTQAHAIQGSGPGCTAVLEIQEPAPAEDNDCFHANTNSAHRSSEGTAPPPSRTQVMAVSSSLAPQDRQRASNPGRRRALWFCAAILGFAGVILTTLGSFTRLPARAATQLAAASVATVAPSPSPAAPPRAAIEWFSPEIRAARLPDWALLSTPAAPRSFDADVAKLPLPSAGETVITTSENPGPIPTVSRAPTVAASLRQSTLRPKTAAKAQRLPPNCAVPYFVDEKGIKRFRPQCFRTER